MKKIFLCYLLIFAGLVSKANHSELFLYNQYEVDAQLLDLDHAYELLEKVGFNTSHLSSNENETLAFLSHQNPNFAMNDGPFGVPSFFWGCTFNVVGILVVYLSTNSKEEVRKSLLGVIAQTVIGIVIITADSSNGATGCASPSIQLSGCTTSGCATGGSGCSSSGCM